MIAVVAVYFAIVATYATVRPIDGDEGYYALASKLIYEGKSPYADFFYPQAPILPYLYSPVIWLFGHKLLYLRILSAVFCALTYLLWLLWILSTSRSGGRYIWLFPTILFLSPGFLDWAVTVKTYSGANLTISIALLSLVRGLEKKDLRWFAFSGLAFGLTTGTRLLYAPSVVVLAALLLIQKTPFKLLVAWVIGLLAGLQPIILSLISDPSRFIFNNIAFHHMRSNADVATLPLKIGDSFGFVVSTILRYPSLLVLLILSAFCLSTKSEQNAIQRRFEKILAVFLISHVVVSALPRPHQPQYLVATLHPLLVPLAVLGTRRIPRRLQPKILIGLVFVGLAVGIYESTIKRPEVLSGPVWRWDHYRRTCARLVSLTAPGDRVLSFWPGYVFETGRVPETGFENQFAVWLSTRLSPAERLRYRISGKDELYYEFRGQGPSAVVVGGWMYDLNEAMNNQETALLINEFNRNYVIIAEEWPLKIALARRKLR